MCLCSGTQYQTSEPQNTSRLSHVDGPNDLQSNFSIMVLTTNDLPPRGPLPPLVSSFISRNGFYVSGSSRGGFWGFWKLLRFIQFWFPEAVCSVCIHVHFVTTRAHFIQYECCTRPLRLTLCWLYLSLCVQEYHARIIEGQKFYRGACPKLY